MRLVLKFSVWLNLVLLGGLIFLLANRRAEKALPLSAPTAVKPVAKATVIPAAPVEVESQPFRWQQLESRTNYRTYIANLRAAGCPEPTIEDIVRGDTERAFAWERSQLKLGSSGNGPWSQSSESQLVASLLEPSATAASTQKTAGETEASGRNGMNETTVAAQDAQNQTQPTSGGEVAESPAQSATAASSYPLFLQNVNWGALGFTPDEQATIAQVRQQFVNNVNGQNTSDSTGQASTSANQNAAPDSGNTATMTHWQAALQDADEQLRALLGAQAYMAYEQQQYLNWFQPQVEANAGGGNLVINPDEFSASQQ